MYKEDFEKLLKQKEYDFLNKEPLGNNIILLCPGGSYAYGTNVEGSDIDIRGIALNSASEILRGKPFEQVIDNQTDTVVYSFTKVVKLLTEANPNVLELLFLDPEQYIIASRIGVMLLLKKNMFLSKRILYTFGGYARSQLSRLDNKTARTLDQEQQEVHILRSIQNAEFSFHEKFFDYPEDAIRLYVDKAVQEGMSTEIFMDVNLHHYPLRDYKCMWSEMHNIVKDYSKIGRRAADAIAHNKVNKHAMHLVRLLKMCTELFETGTMHTHRVADHDLLMDIRNGKYMNEEGLLIPSFFEMVDELESGMNKAAEKSDLPEKPDYKEIDKFVEEVNREVVEGIEGKDKNGN